MDKKKIFRIFKEIETELRPDKYFIKKKIPLWDIVRMSLYKEILIKFDLDKKDKKTIYIYSKNIIWRLLTFLKGLFFSLSKKSPIWIKKNTYIAWGHPRRKYENEKYIDIYIDPFLKLFGLKKKFSVIERNEGYGHLAVHKDEHLFYADTLTSLSNLLSFFQIIKFNKEELTIIQNLKEKIYKKFRCKIDVNKIVRKQTRKWLGTYPLMRLFFKIKKPKLFFIVVSETHEAIISAAKFENIPTIELQHGSPAKGKINYDFSSGIKKSTFPDLFLSYGKFWNLNTLLPIDKKNIITFGYPYLQSKLEKFSNIKKENHLVVIPQLVNSMELMNFAIKVSQFFKGRITVEYKPHPSEYHMLEGSHFNVLRNTGVKISAEKDDLYKIFAKSKWQVGVYSTALYEGLKFGVACFILNISGSEHMDKIISDGLARKINTIYDIDLNYKVNKKKTQMLFRKPKKKDVKKILSFARKNHF